MQWRLHIKDAEDLQDELSLAKLTTFETSPTMQPLVALGAQVIHEQHGAITFDGCVFGNEFCEHLLPSSAALKQAIIAAQARNLAFTLLTPYVSNAGISALRPLFDVLAEHVNAEAVFNDWGVLNLLRREYPAIRPVQGRLLNKSLRDPRVTTMYSSAPAPANALNVLQGSNLDNASYAALLTRLGVTMVEMDNLPQGNDLNANELDLAVYLPFGFISTSRVCMAAGLHYHKADKFQPGAPCRHECQTHLLEYQYTNSPFGNREQKFYLKGNSYFYHHSEPMLRALLAQVAQGHIARLIFQPRLPMMA
jgi:hypothetical protein